MLFQENVLVSFSPLIRSSGVNVANTAESQTCAKFLVVSLTVVELTSTLIVMFSQMFQEKMKTPNFLIYPPIESSTVSFRHLYFLGKLLLYNSHS